MTREEIIDGLEIYTAGRLNKDRIHITVEELQKFIDEIKALEQEPCEDAVSRQAVDELSKELVHTTRDKADFLCNFWEGLQKLPPVTPRLKTGHWIDIMVGDMPAQACDKCNTFYPLAYTGGGHKYCPNCGIRMEVKA